MTKKKASKESRVSKCTKASIRFLIKVRDFYVKCMTQFSGHFACDAAAAAMGWPSAAAQLTVLPRSFSRASTTSKTRDDHKELRRAASVGSYGNKIDLGLRKSPAAGKLSAMRLRRSQSTGIWRIDEDELCLFGEEDYKVKADLPRSRSRAIHTRKRIQ